MTSNVLQKFQSLHYRRTLLEALAQLNCQLHSASEGLATVQQIVRPSTQYSSALRERLAPEIQFYETQDEQKLRGILDALNSNLEKASLLFLRIAKLDDNAFIQNFQADEAHREKFKLLQQKVNHFQKQTHHYLAIRIVLQDRGNQLDIVKLSLPQGVLDQELLAEELEQVRAKEKLQKRRFRNEVQMMLTDTELLGSVAKNNKEVFSVLLQNAERLHSILDILESGGDIHTIPDVIERIHCDLLPEGGYENIEPLPEMNSIDQKKSLTKNSDHKISEKSPAAQSHPTNTIPQPHTKANSFLARVKLWMSTSWKVTWAETKYYRKQ